MHTIQSGLIKWWCYSVNSKKISITAIAAAGIFFLITTMTSGMGAVLSSPRLVFDGQNDYVDLNKLDVSGSAITIEAWFNSNNLFNCSSKWRDCRIVSKADGSSSSDHIWMISTIKSSDETRLRFRLKTNGTTTTLIASSGALSENQWHHAAATYDGASMKLYLDGVEVGSTPKTGLIATDPAVDAYIGSNPVSAKPFSGMIDDVRIWNVARTQTEIAEAKDTEQTGNESGLIGYWRFNDSLGQTASDSSVNGNHAVLGSSAEADDKDPEWDNINPDTQAPTTPQAVSVTAVSAAQVNVAWDPATDDVGVAHYVIERDGVEVGQSLNESFTDTGLIELTNYIYVVYAEDAAGNRSDGSVPTAVTTPAAPDTQPPTAPTNLVETLLSEAQVDLAWNASSDNVAVTSYNVIRDGTTIASVPDPNIIYTDVSVVPGATYTYEVTAEDAAGNISAPSNQLIVTVPAPPDNEAPTVPQNVIATVVGDTSVDLAWDDSTDNVAINKYIVERDGVLHSEVPFANASDTSFAFNTTHSYVIYAEDIAGNRSDPSMVVVATVTDISAPEISTTEPTQSQTIQGVITISAEASDNDTVASVAFSIDGIEQFVDTTAPFEFDWDSTAQSDGTYDFVFTALDPTGNSAETIVSAVVANTSPPSVQGTPHLLFDGSDDLVNLNKLDVAGNAITIEATFNSLSLTNCSSRWHDCRIISKATGTSAQDHYWMISTIENSGETRLRFRLKAGGSTQTLVASSGALSNDQWYQVAAVYDGATMKLYLDGIEVGSRSHSGALDTNPAVDAYIGNNPVTPKPFAGKIDDVRIWDVARSAADIQAYRADELSGTETGLVGYWKFNENSGQTAADSSPQGNDGVLGLTTGSENADPTWNIDIIDTEAPSVPANLTETSVASSTATIGWDASTDNVAVYQYVIERDGVEVGQSSTTSFTDTGLTPETLYSYVVIAEDAAGNRSAGSAPLNVTTDTVAPLTISNIQVSNITPQSARITWETDDVGTSQLEYGLDNTYGTETTLNTTLTTTHTVVIAGLSADTTYHFRVASQNALGVETVSPDSTFQTAQQGGSGGTLGFIETVIDSSPTAPQDLHNKAFGDINNDGFVDIVVSSARDDGVLWYEYPNWTQHHIVATGAYSTDMETADMDGDGDIDMILPEGGSGGLVVWLENPLPTGDPTSTNWVRHVVGSNRAHDVAVADLDNDGRMDVVSRGKAGGNGQFFDIFRQEPDGSFSERPIILANGEGLEVGDINGDGFIDVTNGLSWYANPGGAVMSGVWVETTVTTPQIFGSDELKVAIADINGDGSHDIINTSAEGPAGPVAWFENPGGEGTATWSQHNVDAPREEVHGVQAADFNNDGFMDIVTADMHQSTDPDQVVVYLNDNGDGLSWTQVELSVGGSHNIQVADVGSDGDIDVFGANWNSGAIDSGYIKLWENTLDSSVGGNISFDSWTRVAVDTNQPGQGIFVLPGDLNGDGLDDIVSGSVWYPNPGTPDGNWVQTDIGNNPEFGNVSVIYDIDGDGDLDLFGRQSINGGTGDFVWAENNGFGVFTTHANIDGGTNNGDFLQGADIGRFGPGETGPLQIALSWHRANEGVQMLTIPADPVNQTWTWQQISPTSQDEQITAGDIDNDGDLDLSLGTKWLQNNQGGWIAHDLFITTEDPDRNRMADMDADGDLDIIVGYEAISSNGDLVWYENPGGANATTIWNEHIIATIIGPMSLDVADMDNDGDIDVTAGEHNTVNPSQARAFVFENDGDSLSWTQHVVYTGDEHHDGTQLTDIDNDGDLDIISTSWTSKLVSLYVNDSDPGSGSNSWEYTDRSHRLPVNFTSDSVPRTDHPFTHIVNFTDEFTLAGSPGEFDPNSIRISEIDGAGTIVNPSVPFQFDQDADYDSLNKASGQLVILAQGATAADDTRMFHVYFDHPNQATPFTAATFTDQVVVADDVMDEGQLSFEIVTPSGTYTYQKLAAGFSSIVDIDGNDWINYSTANGHNGEFRGIPNAIFPEGEFHPGATGSTSTLVHDGPIRSVIFSATNDGLWESQWEIYPNKAVMTMLKMDHDYWFLYEGTPGGLLDGNDIVVRPDGTQTPVTQFWQGDLQGEEWVYYGDTAVNRSLFLAHHQDDATIEWADTLNTMTVFGFGRGSGSSSLLNSVPQEFTIGLIDEVAHGQAADVVRGSYQPTTIATGTVEVN